VGSFPSHPELVAAISVPLVIPAPFSNFFSETNNVGPSFGLNFGNQKLVRSFERIVQEDPTFAGLPTGVHLFRLTAGEPAEYTIVIR